MISITGVVSAIVTGMGASAFDSTGKVTPLVIVTGSAASGAQIISKMLNISAVTPVATKLGLDTTTSQNFDVTNVQIAAASATNAVTIAINSSTIWRCSY